jgi:hypothetical protein
MLNVDIHVACSSSCPCCMSVLAACPTMLHVRPCCMSVHAACSCPCCMFMCMLHVRVHAAWSCPCCMSQHILNVHVHAICLCLCCMSMSMPICMIKSMQTDMDIQHGHRPSAWKSTFCLSTFISMLHVHDHINAACTSTRCLSLSNWYAHAHAACPC